MDRNDYARGLRWLCRRDPTLNGVVETWGNPPMWARRPGFTSLLQIILEQQVSLESAQAVMDKLRAQVTRISPPLVLSLSDRQLRDAGFSRQKTRYARILARAVTDGTLDLRALPTLDARHAHERLTSITGIGPWTADVYLMMTLRHRDIWPRGDLALRLAMRELFRDEPELAEQQSLGSQREDELQRHFAQRWRPWRSLAVRICWLHYLRVRSR